MKSLDAVRIRNFLHVREVELDLTSGRSFFVEGVNHDDPSARSNGGGKTMLARALCWCLWGATHDGTKADDVVGKFQDWTEVATWWSEGGVRYVVWRYRKHPEKGNQLVIKINEHDAWSDISRHTSEEAQEWLEEHFLGLSFVPALYSIFLLEDPSRQFTTVSDAERKEVLTKILRLERLDRALKLTKEKLRTNELGQAKMEQEIEHLGVNFDKAVEAVEQANARVYEATEKAGHERAAREEFLTKLRREEEAAQAAIDQYAGFDPRAAEEEIKAEMDEIVRYCEDKIAVLSKERDDLTGRRAVSTERLRLSESLDKLLAEGSDARCPECGQTVSPEHADKIRRSVGKAKEVLEEIRSRAGKIDTAIAQERAVIREAEEGRRGRLAAKAKKEAAKAEAGRVLRDVQARIRLADRKSEGEVRLEEMEKTVETAKAKIAELEAAKKEARAKLADLKERAAVLKFWEAGFGPNGVRKLVFRDAIEIINRQANHYVELIADGGFKVEIGTEIEKKGGGVREGLPIYISRDGMRRPIQQYSSGQSRKLCFAIDYAVHRLVANSLDFVWIDERLPHVDDRGIHRVMALLKDEWISKGKKVVFVGHDPVSKSYFDRTILVEMKDGATSAEIL